MPCLSSRLDESLRAQIVKNAEVTLAAARVSKKGRLRGWLFGAGSVAGLAIASGQLGKAFGHTRASVPFGPSTVISAQTQGLGSGVEELLPQTPSSKSAPEPLASPSAKGRTVPASLAKAKMSSLSTREPTDLKAENRERAKTESSILGSGSCPTCADASWPEEGDLDVLFEADARVARAQGVSDVQPGSKTVINVGSRFDIVLEFPVLAGASASPVSARTATDVVVGKEVALPKGTALVGDAILSDSDDRVQIILKALVFNGNTIPFQGVALGTDSAFGVQGKVVRKGSRKTLQAGRILGTISPALTLGLLGNSSDVVESAAGAMASSAGQELRALPGSWKHAEKTVQLPAGLRMTVYVRHDLVI